ncbi:hypothetical protein ILUMI_16965 [Ignelater luminosus]|uniref:Uncharacterized protein n=1 Tax=Ignelater luminosus TaxID=2038154 RepID=A0A8K0CKR7_IGNLU|nr:hypothetical protein ILUMI_16965 [Ignelater luminosus]
MTQLIPKNKNKTRVSKNITKVSLGTHEEQEKYEKSIDRELKEIQLEGHINEDWEKIKQIISNVAKECNKYVSQKKKNGFDDECQQEIKERSKLRTEMLIKGKIEARNDYEKHSKKVRKVLRTKKRKCTTDKLKEIEENYKNRETRNSYQGVKTERRGYQL